MAVLVIDSSLSVLLQLYLMVCSLWVCSSYFQ